MYRTIDEFLMDWTNEEKLTLQVLEALTDASLSQAVSDKQARTLGDLGWHLASSIVEMWGAGGLQLDAPDYSREQPTPTRAADIVGGYRRFSASATKALKEQWTDEKLPEKLLLFGFIDTTYGGLMTSIVRHQIHHRGQMTILMRQAGLVPPGVYGPNEEETAAMQASQG